MEKESRICFRPNIIKLFKSVGSFSFSAQFIRAIPLAGAAAQYRLPGQDSPRSWAQACLPPRGRRLPWGRGIRGDGAAASALLAGGNRFIRCLLLFGAGARAVLCPGEMPRLIAKKAGPLFDEERDKAGCQPDHNGSSRQRHSKPEAQQTRHHQKPSGLISGEEVKKAMMGPQGRVVVSIPTITAIVPQAQKGVIVIPNISIKAPISMFYRKNTMQSMDN